MISSLFGLFLAQSPLRCFVEHPPSSTTPNICSTGYPIHPGSTTVEDCARACINDPECEQFVWPAHNTSIPCRLSHTCANPTKAAPQWTGYNKNSSCKPTPGAPTPAPPANYSLVLMKEEAKQGSVCLDGSPGGYYIRHGNADTKKWIIFHEGGGWCGSTLECLLRTTTHLGSSKSWDPVFTGEEIGNTFDVAPFEEFTVVYAKYCDGGSWTGNSSETVNNTNPIYGPLGVRTNFYRGRLLLDSMLARLKAEGLDQASDLIYGGCSAGGLTSAQHVDYVASLLPSVRVRGMTDAMFPLKHATAAGNPDNHLYDMMSWGFYAWKAAPSVNQHCLAAKDNATAWQCMIGGILAPYVQTPHFYVQSKYDTWQMKAVLALNCTVTHCDPTAEQAWVDYGRLMVDALAQIPPRHGVHLTNCAGHCQVGRSDKWLRETVNGTTIKDAFWAWYTKEQTPSPPTNYRYVSECDERPCGADVCGSDSDGGRTS
jgi:hypothetical protein